MANRGLAGRIGFLTMAFVIVGLVGVFATYAVPIPLLRALRRETVLDRLATASDPAAMLANLGPALGGSAARLSAGTGSLAQRIAREKQVVQARFIAEEKALAFRLRLIVVLFTLTGAIFGAALLGAGQRSP